MTTIQVQFEILIHQKIERVWHCLIHEAPKWWSKEFYTSTKTKSFHIEGHIGGRAYEDFGKGEGFVWSEVIGLHSPNSIQMKGLLAPEYGGPAISYLSIQLKADGANTTFRFSDTLFGDVNEGAAEQIEAGWKMIYAQAFKNYVEQVS